MKSQDNPNAAKIMDPMDARWQSFGWVTREIDGHDMSQICDALDWATEPRTQPAMIIANTVKGKGVSFFEGQAKYHNSQISEEEYQQALAELSLVGAEKG